MSIAQDLANALHLFNAKERNFLMRFALLGEVDSGPPKQSDDWVNPSFFQALGSALKGDPSQGNAPGHVKLFAAAQCVYAAMDYHLDWLHAALWCAKHEWDPKLGAEFTPKQRCIESPQTAVDPDRLQQDVMGNQEDVDLLLVIEDGDTTHLVLVEAKGVSSFDESQLRSKLKRLELILRKDVVPSGLLVSLVLLAPKRKSARGADVLAMARKHVPEVIGARVFTMKMPNFPSSPYRVTRCNKHGENPKRSKRKDRNQDLGYWTIKGR